MDATIQVRKRGTLTLPAEVRERYNIKPGDTFRLLDLDGIFADTGSLCQAKANTV